MSTYMIRHTGTLDMPTIATFDAMPDEVYAYPHRQSYVTDLVYTDYMASDGLDNVVSVGPSLVSDDPPTDHERAMIDAAHYEAYYPAN